MNSLSEIKKRSATLHGGGYFTPAGTRTEAANDVQFLLEKLEEMTGWRNECGFRYNAAKRDLREAADMVADHNIKADRALLSRQRKSWSKKL